ncbi:MAG: glutaredoxin family protein [Candidatus Bathyarchaeota archaeon]
MNTIKIQGDNNNHKVLIYALSTCGWCNKTKKLLKDNKIAFEFIDVDLCNDEDFETIKNDISKRGARMSFPTIIIDDKHLITGFREEEIKKHLEI